MLSVRGAFLHPEKIQIAAIKPFDFVSRSSIFVLQ